MQSKNATKSKVTQHNTPTYTGNGSHFHVCVLLVIKINTYLPIVKTTVGRYEHTNHLIQIIGRLLVHL